MHPSYWGFFGVTIKLHFIVDLSNIRSGINEHAVQEDYEKSKSTGIEENQRKEQKLLTNNKRPMNRTERKNQQIQIILNPNKIRRPPWLRSNSHYTRRNVILGVLDHPIEISFWSEPLIQLYSRLRVCQRLAEESHSELASCPETALRTMSRSVHREADSRVVRVLGGP
jgi:hypothetical protein